MHEYNIYIVKCYIIPLTNVIVSCYVLMQIISTSIHTIIYKR